MFAVNYTIIAQTTGRNEYPKNQAKNKGGSSRFQSAFFVSININFEAVFNQSTHVGIIFFLCFFTEYTLAVNVVGFLKFF